MISRSDRVLYNGHFVGGISSVFIVRGGVI